MINFEVYEGKLTSLGTVEGQIGKKGTIKFSSLRNFDSTAVNAKGERMRVTVIMKNEAGESAAVNCSGPLSAQLRAAKKAGATKDELEAGLLDLNVMEGEAGIPFITMPGGDATEGKTAAELRKVKKAVKIEALEELVW